MSRTAILIVWTLASVYLVPSFADGLLAITFYYLWYTERETLHHASGPISDPLFLAAAALLLLLGISSSWSTDFSNTDLAQLGFRLLCTFGFILVIAHALAQQRGFSTYLRHIIILAALSSTLICIALYFFGPPADHGRMHGLFRLYNTGRAGHQYAATLPFLAASLLLGLGRWRWLAAAALFTTIMAITLTGTRAAWMASAIGIMAFATAHWQPKPSRFIAIMALCAATVGMLFTYATMHPASALGEVLLPRGDSYRVAIWQTHIASVLNGSVFFGDGALTQQPFVQILDRSLRGAHNLYISVAQQIGVAGLSLFLVVIGWTALRLLRNLQQPMAQLGLSVLLTGCVLSVFNGDRLIDKIGLVWFVFWLPVGIAVALQQKQLDSLPESN